MTEFTEKAQEVYDAIKRSTGYEDTRSFDEIMSAINKSKDKILAALKYYENQPVDIDTAETEKQWERLDTATFGIFNILEDLYGDGEEMRGKFREAKKSWEHQKERDDHNDYVNSGERDRETVSFNRNR